MEYVPPEKTQKELRHFLEGASHLTGWMKPIEG